MALDINKQTGDTLTASEFNSLVEEVNKKVESEPGKVLSDNNYSNQEKTDLSRVKTELGRIEKVVADWTAGPVSPVITVSDEERKAGIYRIGGIKYDLYEKSVELANLPPASEIKEYIISDEPFGNNIYLAVAASMITDGNAFTSTDYVVEKLYVDSDYCTRAVVRCNRSLTDAKLILTVRYVKSDFEKVEFKLTGGIADASAVTLTFPLLKYGKDFAYSLIVDDDKVDSNKLFFTINKKWVDDEKNQHFNQVRTTGHMPEKFLEYTDGCGVSKRFTYGVAVLPGQGNAYIDNFMNPTGKEVGKNYPYLIWPEIEQMMDFGNEIYFHDVAVADVHNISYLMKGFEAAQQAAVEKIGTGMKVLVRPNGNDDYIAAGQQYDDIVFMTTEGGNHTIDSLSDNTDLHKGIIWRRNCDSIAIEDYISRFEKTSPGAWLCDFTHAPSAGMLDGLVRIHDIYGREGTDVIWFATIDEIIEYGFIRKFTKIRKSITGNDVKYTLFVPKIKNGRHPDLSLQVTGLSASTGVEASGGNIIGLSHAVTGSTMLLNLNLNVLLLDLAEKYTTKFESSESSDDEADARYFVSQLKDDLQIPFLARLNAGNIPPVLTSVQINSGAAITYAAIVSITLAKSGSVTYYRIGEMSDLSSATWLPYSGTMKYILSSGYGNKVIYIQLKNDNGESGVKSAMISYQELPAVTYTVIAKTNDSAYGTVTPISQTVGAGGSANVTAAANEGYVIENWIGADASTGIGATAGTANVSNIQADKTIVCNFKGNTTPMPSGKKWVLSFGWPWDRAGLDTETGIDKQMGASVNKPMHTTDGSTIGNVLLKYNGGSAGASLTVNTRKRGATTGNDSGPYPDEYMAKMITPFSTTVEEELPTATITLSSLPVGNYCIKLFSSTIDTAFTYGTNNLKYSVNDVVIEKDNAFPVNNISEFVTFDNIAVTSGTIVIKVVSPDNQRGNPINVLEIEKL